MSKFKVGDEVVVIDPWIWDDAFNCKGAIGVVVELSQNSEMVAIKLSGKFFSSGLSATSSTDPRLSFYPEYLELKCVYDSELYKALK